MECKESSCSGIVNITENNVVSVIVGCGSYADAYPCNNCGRLHWPKGDLVFNRAGSAAYYKNGKLVNKDKDNKETVVG